MVNHYESEIVKHSAHCHSVECITDEKHEHCKVFYVECARLNSVTSYSASTLDAALRMWIAGGQKSVTNVGSVG